MKTTAKALLPAAPVSTPTCAWRTGAYVCRMMPTSARYCLFHRHWLTLIDARVFGRSQQDEFREWWEQFQPYGRYGDNPGLWWADMHVLWACLTGLGEPPLLTDALSRELYLRRAQVRRYRQGVAWERDPWPRMTGAPLPPWHAEQWQAKATAWREGPRNE